MLSRGGNSMAKFVQISLEGLSKRGRTRLNGLLANRPRGRKDGVPVSDMYRRIFEAGINVLTENAEASLEALADISSTEAEKLAACLASGNMESCRDNAAYQSLLRLLILRIREG